MSIQFIMANKKVKPLFYEPSAEARKLLETAKKETGASFKFLIEKSLKSTLKEFGGKRVLAEAA